MIFIVSVPFLIYRWEVPLLQSPDFYFQKTRKEIQGLFINKSLTSNAIVDFINYQKIVSIGKRVVSSFTLSTSGPYKLLVDFAANELTFRISKGKNVPFTRAEEKALREMTLRLLEIDKEKREVGYFEPIRREIGTFNFNIASAIETYSQDDFHFDYEHTPNLTLGRYVLFSE